MAKMYLDAEEDLTGHVDSSFDMPSVEGYTEPFIYICYACHQKAHDHCRQRNLDGERCQCECMPFRSKP